jgi:hypothetical protein
MDSTDHGEINVAFSADPNRFVGELITINSQNNDFIVRPEDVFRQAFAFRRLLDRIGNRTGLLRRTCGGQ